MRKGKVTILMIVLLSFSAIPFSFFIVSGTAAPVNAFNYEPVDWKSGLAGDVVMHEVDPGFIPELPNINGGGDGSGALHTASTPSVGTWVYDWYLSVISGGEYPMMQLRALVGNVEVWVAEDGALMYPDDDPRNDNPLDWQVTDEMAMHMAMEFDTNIYPGVTTTFGAPFDRDGTGTIFEWLEWEEYTYNWIDTDPYNPQRVILKIFNIQDTSYYNPDYPYYVVGFFSPTYTGYYNRNMVHIDNWRYWQRLGDEGDQWYPEHPELEVTRPHVYESTVAHEYQHQVHDDWQPDSELWMNEGCSMLAEPICGYEYPYNYLPYFFATPDNSLIEWGDQGDDNILADYAQVLLWTTYLADHYGEEVLTEYVQSGIPGIAGINAALEYLGYTETMDEVFHNWRIANLIHSDKPGHGIYNYKSIDLGEFLEGEFADPIPRIYELHDREIPWTYGSDFGGTKIYDWYETDIVNVGTYGTDYVLLDNLKRLNLILFEGDAYSTFPHWVQVDGMWYSGRGDLMNTLIATEIEVNANDPWLYLTTYWDIEDNYPYSSEGWDYGFIQVSDDDGETWTSLDDVGEWVNDDAVGDVHPDIYDNLPGITGWSEGWVDLTFDLSTYAGKSVLIAFRYMTDWAFTYEGWYILAAAVGAVDIMGTLELQDYIPEVSWMVSIITMKTNRHGKIKYSVDDMYWIDSTHGIDLSLVNHKEDVILVISPIIEKGSADYRFKTFKLPRWHFW